MARHAKSVENVATAMSIKFNNFGNAMKAAGEDVTICSFGEAYFDIPLYPIVHQGGDAFSVETHRYPFAGAANARVRLGVVSAAGGEPRSTPPPPSAKPPGAGPAAPPNGSASYGAGPMGAAGA